LLEEQVVVEDLGELSVVLCIIVLVESEPDLHGFLHPRVLFHVFNPLVTLERCVLEDLKALDSSLGELELFSGEILILSIRMLLPDICDLLFILH